LAIYLLIINPADIIPRVLPTKLKFKPAGSVIGSILRIKFKKLEHCTIGV
jgi:hypothetical protein